MSRDKPSIARIAFELDLHRDTNDDEVRFGDPNLEYAHKQVLEVLSYDEWRSRRYVLKKTSFRRKKLKKHVEHLKEYDYIEERQKPGEGRMKEYRRIST